MTGWVVRHNRIDEHVVPGKRLGRHVRHDSRSLGYPYQAPADEVLQSTLHARHIPILDQGQVGSCTGNAETGALGSDPLYATVPAGTVLDEAEALRLYSAAETIDGDGPYPPQDNGSTGTSVCQAALNAGLISGYTHCFSLASVLSALQIGPVIVGSNWYDSMDAPNGNGLVSISPGAYVRGGHEYLVRGIDTVANQVLCDNSWGVTYGLNGSFLMGWTTLDRLLSEQGDATVSVPLTSPAPVPVPVPPSADQVLATAVKPWVSVPRSRPDLVALRQDLQTWLAASHLLEAVDGAS